MRVNKKVTALTIVKCETEELSKTSRYALKRQLQPEVVNTWFKTM